MTDVDLTRTEQEQDRRLHPDKRHVAECSVYISTVFVWVTSSGLEVYSMYILRFVALDVRCVGFGLRVQTV